jgi:ABC-type sugar transport system substrate-binding protein
MLKKIPALIAMALLSVAVVFAGGGGDSSTKSNASGKKTIALSLNALDEYHTEWWGHLKTYGESLGYTMIMTNADGKVEKQINDVESLIEQKPAIIIIRAIDSEGAVPAFEACDAAGIPTIDSGFGTTHSNTLKLLSSQFNLCALQADYCIEWLKAHPSETLRAGYLWGMQGVSATQDRYEGWKQTLLKAYPNRVEILAEKVCNWSAVETMAAVEDWMQAFPQMNCIVAMSDEMAIAATNVLQAAGKGLDKCIVIGIDGSPNAQKSLRDGTLSATVYTSKRSEARLTVDYAVRIMNGEWKQLAGKTIDPGQEIAALMTAKTIDQILALEK